MEACGKKSISNNGCCSCDPLKRIIRKFVQNGILKDPVNEIQDNGFVSRLHLFYKSSVLRLPIAKMDGKLQCRITEESLANLMAWIAADTTADSKSNERNLPVLPIFDTERAIKLTSDTDPDSMLNAVVMDKFGNLTFELNINKMKGNVIRWMVAVGWLGYSKNACHNQLYQVEIGMTFGGNQFSTIATSATGKNERNDDDSDNDSSSVSFLEYRKILIAQAISTALKKIGHRIDDTHFTSLSTPMNCDELFKIQPNTILIAAKSKVDVKKEGNAEKSIYQAPETVLRVDVGCVSAHPVATVRDMLSKRLEEIKIISESRRSESLLLSSWTTSLDNLTRATLHYDLLYRPLETAVQLNSVPESVTINNDALFIMYNYSRILSILRKFAEQVNCGEYPELPHVDKVDFTRICERQEELHLLHLLMEWPRIMESAVNFLLFQLNIPIILKYLLALAKAFNSFYFQIVVLVPSNASHNFPAMIARVYFVKAICRVFEDCLDILQVNHSNAASPLQHALLCYVK